jgi:glycosyltransferase involved in cell wall biosynthesis
LKASILINSYNYGKYLRHCIDSALLQTYPDTQVIVVDDGSNDDSAAIIDSYGPAIVPIFKSNGGQASCFNAGFARSDGDIIFFLDADDEFHPHKISILVEVYRDLTVQWCFDRADPSAIPDASRFNPKRDVALCDCRKLIAKNRIPDLPAPTSGLSFRRALLSKVLPMPTAPGITLSDNYLKFAAASLGIGAICRAPLTYQRIHGNNRYTFSQERRQRQTEIGMETGVQLAKAFPDLSGVAIKLAAHALAETAARRPAGYWPGLRRCFREPFTYAQKTSIAARSIMLIVKNLFRVAGGDKRSPRRTRSQPDR